MSHMSRGSNGLCQSTAKSKQRRSVRGALAGLEIFRNVPRATVEALSEQCQWRWFGAGQTVLKCCEDTQDVFFIVSGEVRVIHYSLAGREVRFRDLPAGEMFGELS